MRNDNLLQKVKRAGFESIDDFVKANVDYLPMRRKDLFNTINEMKIELYKANEYRRYFQGECYYGKS
jgi:hypothetical protein